MITAVLSSALVGREKVPSRLSQLVNRFMSVLVESRVRSAARELRRHEAFISDLSRRQDHSAEFLDKADLLPAKI
ncbi:hypothetical protein [Microvirga lotononidis]|uniref:Uncharacterized protein n=1 Tax=Microvirga lotononidis TaxID=864069 RepID=I4YVJ1_9HYPH|nr:hypothetical protein [Microvirga lotononidis]EIM27983.1 hypothetical protein MicloDRAFT_00045600 [Microvirga lotononidis]WQO27898.1 hypothetical protein U0023_01965 [Microvirga lotononidis]